MIEEESISAVPVSEKSDLFIDLGYDSLGFMYLLMKIEKAFSIKFELMETGMCSRADKLIELVERKVRERVNYDKALTD